MAHRMTRREFIRMAGMAAGAAALSACGAPAPAEGGGAEPAATQAPAQQVTLEFWTFNDFAVGTALDLFKTFISEFEAENPGIKVNITGKPGTDILAGLIAGAGSGDLPDAVQIQLGTGGQLIEANAIADVKPYWDQMSEDYRQQFNPPTMELLNKEGKVWGLPFSAYATVLFRNLKVLREAGIDPEAGLADWTELAVQADKIKAAGPWALGKILGSDWIQKHWYGGVTGAKKGTIAPDGKSVLLEADKYATMFEFLLKVKPATAGSFMYDTPTTDLFVTDQLAYCSMGPWLAPTLDEAKEKSGLEWDAILIPGQTSNDFGSVKGGEFTPIMPGKNMDAAWKWAAFVSDSRQTARFASQLGRFMANDRALQDPEVQKNELVQLTAKAFEYAVLEGPLMLKVASGWSQPEIDYGTLVDQGTMEPMEAATKMIAEMNDILSSE